jgi:hypothetical protein
MGTFVGSPWRQTWSPSGGYWFQAEPLVRDEHGPLPLRNILATKFDLDSVRLLQNVLHEVLGPGHRSAVIDDVPEPMIVPKTLVS